MNVAVVGASNNPDRYSYQAVMLLKEKGHTVFPVHPKIQEIEGIKVYHSLRDILEPLDVISLYISYEKSDEMASEILQKHPKRLIFNPGAENPELGEKADAMGIETLDACTLVMLKIGQF